MRGEGAVVPVAQASRVRADLLDHVGMVREVSAWLHERGDYAPSAFFAVVCLEEAAKCHVLDSCARRGRDMAAEDRQQIGSPKKRTSLSLRKMLDDDAGWAGMGADAVAARLDTIKQLAVCYEYVNGGIVTLEGALGVARLRRLSERLQEIAAGGVMSLEAATRGGGNGHGKSGIGPALAEIMELASAVPKDRAHEAGGGMPAGDLPAVLQSLEDHVAVLDKYAVDLHNGGHYEASIFMSIISFEEASRHYVLARCRRQGAGVEGEQVRELRRHNGKLSVFFRDVARYLGDRNVDERSKPPGRYAIIHPEAFLKLNGLKQLAMYFDHMCGRTMTLRGVLGSRTGWVSKYLRDILIGMVSWAIICDGDSENPYRRHNTNPVHYERYQALVRFKTNPKNAAYDQAMYWLVGKLDYLNDAVQARDARKCEAELSHVLARLKDPDIPHA